METNTSATKALLEGHSVRSLVLRLGVPAMFGQFFNLLYSIVDRVFVGWLPQGGELALAGIGICAPALTAVTAFAYMVGIGGAALMSISLGQQNADRARQALGNAFWLLVGMGAAVTAVLLPLHKPLLYLLGCSDALYPYAGPYFTVYILGTLASLLGVGLNQFLLAQGFARQGMIAVVLGALTNVVLDPLFLFGLRLGVVGAAAATVVQSFLTIVFCPSQGITTGCGTIFSYHYGAGNYPKVRQAFWWVFVLCGVYIGLLELAVQAVPGVFAGLFLQDEALIGLASVCLRRYTLALLGVAVQYALVDSLTAMGKVRYAFPLSIFRKLLYLVCLVVLPRLGPVENVFYVGSLSDLAGATFSVVVFFLFVLPRLRREMQQPA